MATVYAYDQYKGLVKIIERGGYYYIYAIRKIFMRGKYGEKPTYEYIWNTDRAERFVYQPYESGDVSTHPDNEVEYVKRMHQHLFSWA
jgi:hypothetical protein